MLSIYISPIVQCSQFASTSWKSYIWKFDHAFLSLFILFHDLCFKGKLETNCQLTVKALHVAKVQVWSALKQALSFLKNRVQWQSLKTKISPFSSTALQSCCRAGRWCLHYSSKVNLDSPLSANLDTTLFFPKSTVNFIWWFITYPAPAELLQL